jgi:hypothetical protein
LLPRRDRVDAVALFAVLVFAGGWYFYARTDPGEPLVRLFFGVLMVLGAAIGLLGLIFRLLVRP